MVIDPLKVLVYGSPPEDRSFFQADERIVWMFYVPDTDELLTATERYLELQKMLKWADDVILDVRHGDPTFDEGVILQTAYSKQTPIFLIGDCLSSELIHHFESNAFLDSKQVVQHIIDNYI